MTIAYTLDAQNKVAIVKQQIDSYINKWYSHEHRHWLGKDEIGSFIPADECSTKHHQNTIQMLKQSIETICQESLITAWELDAIENKESARDTIEKIWPLVQRRNKFAVLKEILGKDPNQDGALFSFSEPEEIVVNYQYCNCGAISKDPLTMTEAEAYLAEQHLKECKNIRIEKVASKSQVSMHKVGHWDCRACFKTPVEEEHTGVAGLPFNIGEGKSSTSWCPKFLRTFRNLSPEGYRSFIKDNSCYGGILHKQISCILRDGNEYILFESKCDTCGYYISEMKQKVTE